MGRRRLPDSPHVVLFQFYLLFLVVCAFFVKIDRVHFIYCFWVFCSFILDIRNNSLLIIERLNLHYYAIIIILVENGLKTAILSLIAIISGTIYRPAKFVIVTGLIV